MYLSEFVTYLFCAIGLSLTTRACEVLDGASLKEFSEHIQKESAGSIEKKSAQKSYLFMKTVIQSIGIILSSFLIAGITDSESSKLMIILITSLFGHMYYKMLQASLVRNPQYSFVQFATKLVVFFTLFTTSYFEYTSEKIIITIVAVILNMIKNIRDYVKYMRTLN